MPAFFDSASEPHGRYGALSASAGVELLSFGARNALFHEGLQRIAELNSTATFIWRALATGQDPKSIVQAFAEQGVEEHHATNFVEIAIKDWLAEGWIVPDQLGSLIEKSKEPKYLISILGVVFSIRLYGDELRDEISDFLSPLKGLGAPTHEAVIMPWGGGFLLLLDTHSVGWFSPKHAIPALKAVLTERLIEAPHHGFFAHGALLDSQGRRFFLSGAPGVGKSTLATALTVAGFECRADDVVFIDPQARMAGAPFSLTLKSGSWPLLEDIVPSIGKLPIYERGDGQKVRYIASAISSSAPRAADLFIILKRNDFARQKLEPIDPLDSIKEILENAFAASGRVSAMQIRSLAESFLKASHYALHYDNLSGAIELLTQLVHV